MLHFGDGAVRNLAENLGRTVVISLYSGLGGAEEGFEGLLSSAGSSQCSEQQRLNFQWLRYPHTQVSNINLHLLF